MPIFRTQPTHTEEHWIARVRIRLATRRDLPALEWGGVYRHFRNLYADAFARMEQGRTLIWLAEIPGKGIVGQIFVQLICNDLMLADGKTRAYVFSFRVKPEYRKNGLGTTLMEYVERDLIRRGFCAVTLNVAQDNPAARRLYERLGYVVQFADPGCWSYFDDKGVLQYVEEPAWRMEKQICDHFAAKHRYKAE